MSIYKQLGVDTYINARGTITNFGGSLMHSDVLQAMKEASEHFVDIRELHRKAGEYIASLLDVEAASVVNGAAAGLAISAAAIMAGTNKGYILQLPDTKGLKNEAIIIKCHRSEYDQAVLMAGARFVEVGSTAFCCIEQLENAISDKTAMMVFSVEAETMRGSIPFRDVASIMDKHDIPIIVDCAAEIPPVSNIRKYLDEGASLVVFSGGKEIRGPQSSGLILGKKQLIEACDLNCCPHHSLGRAMKIDKETICGLVKAVELFVSRDYEEELRKWDLMANYFADELSSAHIAARTGHPIEPGIEPKVITRAYLSFKDYSGFEIYGYLVARGLITGADSSEVILNPQCLQEGEEKKIVEIIKNLEEELYK